ncbi:MAG: DUF4041 domain-containing protein [Micrococcales bacterium]|nr:DUF4041 domain-containing protein [Micrococcales bacterium]
MSTPAGWYPDPHDASAVRWWDGQTWTGHVRPGVMPPAPPPAQPPAPPPPPSGSAAALEERVAALRAELDALRQQVVETSDAIILQEVGIYDYSHPLDSSAEYEDLLGDIEKAMKECVKTGGAVTSTKKWVINGSEKEGARMVADFGKLILRAYNNEADNVVRTLKPYTLEAAIGRLDKLRAIIAKLGASMKLGVTDAYHDLRVRELKLTADFAAKLAEEREREREERAKLKEEEAAKREFEREQQRLEKEKAQYEAALAALRAKGDPAAVAKAEEKLVEIQQAIDGVVRRAANIRAGHVYVISNIGSFGEQVVKIGMTRRLEPMDRVRELGDASVPFRFDLHALFFSEDAVGIETELHKEFADRRVNLVNAHREFFYATPAEVKAALKRLRGDLLTFFDAPEALEWHQSEKQRRLHSTPKGGLPTGDREAAPGTSAALPGSE